jgi:hypothetical protein
MKATRTTTVLGLAAGVATGLVLAGLAIAAEDPPAADGPRTAPSAAPPAAPSAGNAAPAAATTGTATPAAATTGTATPAATSGNAPPGTPAKPDAARSAPQRFEPTEKVRADFEVSFPIDI